MVGTRGSGKAATAAPVLEQDKRAEARSLARWTRGKVKEPVEAKREPAQRDVKLELEIEIIFLNSPSLTYS